MEHDSSMTAFAGRYKRTVLLLADLDGPEIGHLRTEAKRRYDLGFVVRNDTHNVKISDLSMVGALIRVAYFSDASLKYLNTLCVEHGPLTAFAYDYDYSGPKADFCLKLPFIKYRRYSRNPENLLALFGEISHDIQDMARKQGDAGQSNDTNFRPLGHRIRNAAIAIRSFNLNSTSQVVADLDEIANELLATVAPSDRKFDVSFEAKKALIAIGNLYDHV
jgi:hypothetical protein